jgi:maltose alpha-D-glucosyltransferase/alpha-amylase
VPDVAREVIGSYLESARLLGQRTGELHLALASSADEPSFAPEPFTTLYQRSLYQSMRSQTRQAFDLLRKRVKELPEATRETAQKLLAREEEVIKRGRAVFENKIKALRTRCHGDYHLTQLLYTGKDFVVIGLDGETYRPISQRRLKHSPVRDVACMLRSFHYAALSALQQGNFRAEDVPVLEPRTPFWWLWVSVAFLKAYLETAGRGSFLPSSRHEQTLLLDFYLLKRAMNELRYDLTTHLDRVKIPLQALWQILEAGG